MASAVSKPLIVHILNQMDVGGMETVALNLIERSSDRYRHAVVCMQDRGSLAARAEALGASVLALGKKPGKDLRAYGRLWRLLRRLRADIVHTYNIGAIDAAPWARLAGVRHIIHAEHGRDAADPQGSSRKYRRLRRLLAPAISIFVAVSEDLASWLVQEVGIADNKVQLIRNGIDLERYHPEAEAEPPWPAQFAPAGSIVVGSVGRLNAVKAFADLLQAFARVQFSDTGPAPRLVIVGSGPEQAALEQLVHELGIAERVWLAGERDDVPQLLQAMDVYVCSSIAEGMALTLLEAMASGLPVIATQVGGNPELVLAQETGLLVPASDAGALADAIETLVADPELRREQGQAGRQRAQACFSMAAMTAGYCALYDQLLGPYAAATEAG
ncbi:MAG TPA: TIGR03088 family PEP-CTERM/XrtA system glycosyltransferase [Salinisphaeraceae bacterium]|nr:TIGR03088 family PEP-CTERM/XrtA system glycosyltransferase [Salinisphaeraceae bacterium]